jgi:hypothetical protein
MRALGLAEAVGFGPEMIVGQARQCLYLLGIGLGQQACLHGFPVLGTSIGLGQAQRQGSGHHGFASIGMGSGYDQLHRLGENSATSKMNKSAQGEPLLQQIRIKIR